MSEPTRDEKLATLRNAGKRVPNTATDEEIDFALLELEAEREQMEAENNAANAADQEARAAGETSETDSAHPARTYATRRDFAEAAALLSDPKLGNKTPELIEWAKANLSPDDLADIYPNL